MTHKGQGDSTQVLYLPHANVSKPDIGYEFCMPKGETNANVPERFGILTDESYAALKEAVRGMFMRLHGDAEKTGVWMRRIFYGEGGEFGVNCPDRSGNICVYWRGCQCIEANLKEKTAKESNALC